MDPYFEMYFGVDHWTGEQRGGVFPFFKSTLLISPEIYSSSLLLKELRQHHTEWKSLKSEQTNKNLTF